jgi:hypothetical protein
MIIKQVNRRKRVFSSLRTLQFIRLKSIVLVNMLSVCKETNYSRALWSSLGRVKRRAKNRIRRGSLSTVDSLGLLWLSHLQQRTTLSEESH